MTRLPFIVAIQSFTTLIVTCDIVRRFCEARNAESTSSSATLADCILCTLLNLARERIAYFASRGVRVFAARCCQKRIDGGVRVDASEFIQEVRRKIHLPRRLPSQIHRSDLRTLVAKLAADGLASNCILRALRGCEHPRNRTAGRGRFPASQRLIPFLRIVVP